MSEQFGRDLSAHSGLLDRGVGRLSSEQLNMCAAVLAVLAVLAGVIGQQCLIRPHKLRQKL